MARKEEHVETDVDRLYHLVKRKKRISVIDAAKALKRKPEILEEWGRVLEEHGLIRVYYPPFKQPFFEVKEGEGKKPRKIAGGRRKRSVGPAFLVNVSILTVFFIFLFFYGVYVGNDRLVFLSILLILISDALIGIYIRKGGKVKHGGKR